MRFNIARILTALVALAVATLPTISDAQPTPKVLPNTGEVLASWIALDAPTGHEHLASERLLRELSGWQRDRHGNLIKTVGAGSPHRVVACGLDSHAFAVTQITADGYLRLHRIGSGTGHPLWDQAHEGQHVRVLTNVGPVVGTVGIANAHFAAQHRTETATVTADQLWVDVGAASQEEVREMGIQLLDPVVRQLPPWFYAGEVAGPGAGARAGCAAIAAAAQSQVQSGRTTWVISTQQVFGWVGLGGAVTRLAPVDEVILAGRGATERRDVRRGARLSDQIDPVLAAAGVKVVREISPRVADPGALMERLDVTEAEALLQTLLASANSALDSAPAWIAAPAVSPVTNDIARPTDEQYPRMAEFVALLDRLAEVPGVPGHEGPVRAIVHAALPQWAQKRAHTDEHGNLWVEMGPPGDATVFIAHLDEVGWVVDAIDEDGTVKLAARGGVVPSAWEGQPARIQISTATDAASPPSVKELKGVFLTRSAPQEKRPSAVTAWFGMNGQQLASAGIKAGMGVTGHKQGHRIGRYRYASRSLDDRAGTTALLMAIRNLDPARLAHRVIFAWSVREEGGLIGARALAARFGKTSRRAYSVDTFVTSDTPLELRHFAFAPLGSGPVLRSIENSSMVTRADLERNLGIARTAGVPVQIGLTQGGTDGTTFTFWGAPNAGLSWPGRYSHTPAEVADLRDLVRLTDLVVAMASAAQ